MNPEILFGKNVIIQGITGSHGSFQAKAMIDAGTNIVAGTSPNKAGESIHDVPVYSSIQDIQKDFSVDCSVIFVPAKFAKGAIFEAISSEIPLIVCITEGIPIHDMLKIKQKLAGSNSVLIGPNSPGVIVPGINKLGIIPASMAKPGNVAVVSRSGTLTYEAMASLSEIGIGQRYVIGIGGDPIRGTGFIECLEMFENDKEVKEIVLIGEIGGTDEILAAEYIKKNVTKPVYAYVAGHHAPAGIQMGHAGAILGSKSESAHTKTEALADAGAHVATSVEGLIRLISKD